MNRIEARRHDLPLPPSLHPANRASAIKPFLGTGNAQVVWDQLDIDRRRAVIAELAEVVISSPGRGAKRFDPSTVRMTPRRPYPA